MKEINPTDVFIISLIKYSINQLELAYRDIMGIHYEDSKCFVFSKGEDVARPQRRMVTRKRKVSGKQELFDLYFFSLRNYPFFLLLLIDK